MKAFVLAAGRGERLRPLTDRLPKALVPAGGRPLLEWHFERLGRAGFREVIVNVAYLGERIVEFAGDGSRWNLSIEYSREPEPLETAGALAFARERIGSAPHLLLNADIYCEFDLARLRQTRPAGLAHLVLVPNPPHREGGDFTLQNAQAGAIEENPGAPRYTYSGIGVFAPALVAALRPGDKVPLGPLIREAAMRGAVSAEVYRGAWHDVGTLLRLESLEAELERKASAPVAHRGGTDGRSDEDPQ